MHLFLQRSSRGPMTCFGGGGEGRRGGGGGFGGVAITCGTLMHKQSVYTGLHHRNLEHKGCTFKSMHRPTMINVVLKKKTKNRRGGGGAGGGNYTSATTN